MKNRYSRLGVKRRRLHAAREQCVNACVHAQSRLREADDVDLGELGLKKPEIKRLRRYLEEQI